MRYNHYFLREYPVKTNLYAFLMFALYIRDTSSVSMWLVYGQAMVSMTSRISTYSCLFRCKKYKIIATSVKSSFVSEQASANPNIIKLFITYLVTKENEFTAIHTVYVEPQIEQVHAQHTLYSKPRWRVKREQFILNIQEKF